MKTGFKRKTNLNQKTLLITRIQGIIIAYILYELYDCMKV